MTDIQDRLYKLLDDTEALVRRYEASIAKIETEAESIRQLRKSLVALADLRPDQP